MPILLAIPLFTFAGYVLSESQAPARLVRLTSALARLVAGWPGDRVDCRLRVLHGVHGRVRRHDHRARGAAVPGIDPGRLPGAFHARAWSRPREAWDLLFAPSLPLILYGVVAEIPIDDLFVAGIIPGYAHDGLRWRVTRFVGRIGQNRTPLSGIFDVGSSFAAIARDGVGNPVACSSCSAASIAVVLSRCRRRPR